KFDYKLIINLTITYVRFKHIIVSSQVMKMFTETSLIRMEIFFKLTDFIRCTFRISRFLNYLNISYVYTSIWYNKVCCSSRTFSNKYVKTHFIKFKWECSRVTRLTVNI